MTAAAQFRAWKPSLIAFAPSPIRTAADSESRLLSFSFDGSLASGRAGQMRMHAKLRE